MFSGAYTPEQPVPSLAAEFDRLYLEKCHEVNELEQKVEKYKSMAELAVKQKRELDNRLDGQKALLEERSKQLEKMKQEALTTDLISRKEALKAVHDAHSTIIILPEQPADWNEGILSQFQERRNRAIKYINEIPAVSSAATIRELAAEPLKGFTPDVEPPEELPEALMEELPLWALQPVTSQDILCLSSALKNLYEIHKCDGWLLYNKLAKVLEQKIKEYCGED